MKGFKTFLIFLLFISYNLRADSWVDPEWKDMIEQADVIALIEYQSSGDFRAKAKPLKIYKGKIKAKEIWLTGFSNRYGPIDKMSPGDKYLVFLSHNKLRERSISYWKENLKKEPDLSEYYQALKKGRSYSVSSPTSGDLKVSGKKVQYDLLQTTFYQNQSFFPLNEFEQFLKATQKKGNKKFHQKTLAKLIKSTKAETTAQYLMMLQLTTFKTFDPIFQSIADQQNVESSFALARLLGQIEGKESRELLIQLLKNENSIVQGETVKQLSKFEAESIGPVLLAHLDASGIEGNYPNNIMDPVRNKIDGGKIEIIKTLGKLKYKPAANKLLSILETDDPYLFKLVIDVLIELESKDFIPHLNQHLKKKTKPLIFEICKIITDQNLHECKAALMEFILTHDRNDHPGHEYAISPYLGLAHFDEPEIKDFLLKDFDNLISNSDTIESQYLEDWIREYIETFKILKTKEARPLIYKSLFHWFGYNYQFAEHPELVAIKKSLEDSINQKTMKILSDYKVQKIHSLVHIQNGMEIIKGANPIFDYIIQVSLYPKIKEDLISFDEGVTDNDGVFELLKEIRNLTSLRLNIPLNNVGARRGTYVDNLDERFDINIDFSPMYKFYRYAEELPNAKDLKFLKVLEDSDFAKSEFDIKQLKKTIQEVEEKLNKEN